jgi:hypothetical protein
VKILQEPSYQPITFILETRQEAETFWAMVRDESDPRSIALRVKFSDWFSTNYQ